MSTHPFVITELRTGTDPRLADEGERFEWTASRSPSVPFTGTSGGGARACPLKPWSIGGQQRTVRTDYGGARTPSEQVLGPARKPFTLRGRWDDRYNGEGYALAEQRRFEAMCQRGNLCRFQYGPIVVEGIITDWDCQFQRTWDCDYEFTVSVHQRPDETNTNRSPPTPTDPRKALDDLDDAVQAMTDVDALAPRSLVAGTLADDVTEVLVANTTARERLATTIDNRDQQLNEQPVDGFRRMASQFRASRAAAYEMLILLAGVRSDLDMAASSPAIAVLNFEDWVRSMRYTARLAMGKGREGDIACTERSEPNASRLYRPQNGEHLYAIARKFYGTPHAWRLIADRNALTSFEMQGTEILVIPERSA